MKGIIIAIVFSWISLIASAQSIYRTACQGNLDRLDSILINTSIDIKDNRGKSLMHWAVACKQIEIFDYLVEKGIDINGEDDNEKTPIHVAVRFGNYKFFDLLVDLQSNNDWIIRYGGSLLEQAVLNRDSIFIEKLIKSGIDVNSKNDRGSTPLEISKRIGAKDLFEFLLSQEADQNLIRHIETKGKYMGQSEPGNVPQMFAPNFISTEEQEFGSVFNSAGTEFFYGVDVNGKNEIRYSRMTGNQWSNPEIFLSHERYGYNDPFLSPDEDRLYFISKMPLDGLGKQKDVDIWYIDRIENGWSKPVNAGQNINTKGNEYYISFTHNGTMYFSSNGHNSKEGKRTDYNIYYSELINEFYQKPVLLGESINTNSYEADVFVSPDESYIIFCSTRENGFGQGDLYISFRKPDSTWTVAINMGNEINTKYYEYCPFVTKDGKFLFYTSNQDIYWVSTEIINQLKLKSR
jgi:hypothetical protein